MIAHQIRSTAVAGLLVVAAIGLWISLDPAPQPDAVGVEEQISLSTGPREALDTLEPPHELPQALATARTFAVSLYQGDLAALHELVTPTLATTLLTPTRQEQQQPFGRAAVEGTITRDIQPDRVLVDVIVRRSSGHNQRLETVTVSVIHSGGHWLIDDVAF